MTGIVFIALTVLLRILSNPLGNVFQKRLTAEGQQPLFVNLLTYLGLSILSLPIAFRMPWKHLSPQFWLYSVLGGAAGALGNGFLVKALEKGELSVLGPINAYKSVIGIVTGIFLLGEIPNAWGITGVLLVIGGSYFVLDAGGERFSFRLLKRKDIQYRIWAMVLTAIEAVFDKKLILASSPLICFLSWCWWGSLFALLFLPLYGFRVERAITKPGTRYLLTYLYLILCIGIMQLATIYVLAHMPVGYALSLFQLSIMISVWFGHRFFEEKEIRKKLIGSLIMILGSILIILLKN